MVTANKDFAVCGERHGRVFVKKAHSEDQDLNWLANGYTETKFIGRMGIAIPWL